MKQIRDFFCAVIMVTSLVGCASAILKSYVGKLLVEPVLDHGPPLSSFDLGDGRRAFVWQKNVNGTIPGNSRTSGNINIYGDSAIYNSTTITSPATQYSYECYYT